MTELTPEKTVKIQGVGRPQEARGLADITAMMNTDAFVEGDGVSSPFSAPGTIPSAADQKQVRRSVAAPVPKPAAPVQAPPDESEVIVNPEDEGLPAVASSPTTRTLPDTIFTTGKLRVGKDHILTKLGYTIHGFADPIYALCEMFFGTADKTKPGIREFMQTVGQWGRGAESAIYKLTPARAIFLVMIRSMAATGQLPKMGVDWKAFGHENLWVNALLERIKTSESIRNAVSNVRFENEYNKLVESGYTHFHVMCSSQTWEKRLKAAGVDMKAPALKDTSEKLAHDLDRDTLERIRLKPRGPKLRVIWNDEMVKSPSPRLYSLAELN